MCALRLRPDGIARLPRELSHLRPRDISQSLSRDLEGLQSRLAALQSRLAVPTQSATLRHVTAAAGAIGAIALGAFAIGALAIGAFAIGRLSVRKARFHSLEIDELTVRKLRSPNAGARQLAMARRPALAGRATIVAPTPPREAGG